MAFAIAFDVSRIAKLGGQWPFDAGIGAVICAAALLRARNRGWAAVFGLAVFGLGEIASLMWRLTPAQLLVAPLIGLTVLAGSQARWLPVRSAVIVTAAGACVVAAAETSHGASFDPKALYALFGAVVWTAGAAVGVWLRYLDQRRLAALEAIRRNERLDLARELHDVVAHHVTGIVVQAQAARFAGQAHSGTLAGIESAGLDTLAAIRRLVGLLRDPDDTGSVSSVPEPIDQLVERFARHGPAVDLRIPSDLAPTAWPPEVASTVYRIVQESLTNVARHAPDAVSVIVTIRHDPEEVSIEVTDNAPAATHRASRPGGGYGLIGMRERVEALGGRLQVGPMGDAGWAVLASVPVRARSTS
jgi:signal transduction histidine kinase